MTEAMLAIAIENLEAEIEISSLGCVTLSLTLSHTSFSASKKKPPSFS